MSSNDQYVCSKVVAALLAVKGANFLEKDRHEAKLLGRPPLIPYIRLGKRRIRYKLSDVQAYLESRRVT